MLVVLWWFMACVPAAKCDIIGPPRHSGNPFTVVVQFSHDVPDFTKDDVEYYSGSTVTLAASGALCSWLPVARYRPSHAVCGGVVF